MIYFRFMTSNPRISWQHGSKTVSVLTYPMTLTISIWTRVWTLTALTLFLSACISPPASPPASPSDRQNAIDVAAPVGVAAPTLPPQESPSDATSNSETPDTTDPAVTLLESGLTRLGTIQSAGITEASGMAFSGRQSNLLWLINDSGNDAILFAVTTRGNAVASYEIAADNRDWEDLAQFNLNGESYLLIADIGDNLVNQSSYRLHLLPEPIPDTRNNAVTEPALQPLLSFDLMYEDGSHNAEAATVAGDGMLYIITKDDSPAVYAAPIREAIDSTTAGSSIVGNVQAIPLMAKRIGTFDQPSLSAADALINLISGVALNAITALDVDNNQGEAWFLTYRGIYKLPAVTSAGSVGGWPGVLLSKPVKLANHGLNQAEAMAVSPMSEGIFTTSEGRSAPLLRLIP